MGNAGGQLAERGELSSLDKLILFVAQLPYAALQRLHLGTESALVPPRLSKCQLTILRHDLRHNDQTLSAFSLSASFRRLSSSFSRAIIFSSRPTTTSSNFSRSKIFSCNSAFDCCRSRTTRS